MNTTQSRNDGGPAFPGPFMNSNGALECVIKQGGMTLRDWFAGQAMQSLILNPECARLSYAMANAMLAERAKERM